MLPTSVEMVSSCSPACSGSHHVLIGSHVTQLKLEGVQDAFTVASFYS